MRAWFWFIVDTGWFLVTVTVTILAGVAIVATPIWLQLIHGELVAIRGGLVPCQCSCSCDDDGPGPVLPRVLPRLRNLREEAGE